MFTRFMAGACAAVFAAAMAPAFAQYPLNPPPPPQTGSSNEAVADLNVSHPATTPCVVTLFSNLLFEDFSPKPITYTPPAACPGPWAKVVFVGDFSVTAGIQYDRTSEVYLGNVNLFFGTTPEPSPDLSPSWSVQRDVTYLSPLFVNAQTGAVNIGNLVNETYTGIIEGSGYLYFYPFPSGTTPTSQGVPDQVIPLNTGNGAATLTSPANTLQQTISFPTNMTNLYLEVIAQSQNADEFWYTCVPNDLAGELFSCGGTGMRQAEVFVDGQLAGLAPVSPWIYTGGIDPYLWFPTPGAQTLNFIPYRVNLTPFVGMLDNGQPHTVGVAVFNNNYYFSVSADLLAFQDTSVSQITGALTQVNVPAPAPTTSSNITAPPGGTLTGTVDISSNPVTTTSGYIQTPQGKVTTTVNQSFDFDNTEAFVISNTVFQQDIAVTNNVTTATTTVAADGSTTTQQDQWMFPLTMGIAQVPTANGGLAQTTTSQQAYEDIATADPVFSLPALAEKNIVNSADTLNFDSSFNLIGNSGMASSQRFEYQETANGSPLCYDRTITNANNAVASVADDQNCDLFPPPPALIAPTSVTIPGANEPRETHAGPFFFTANGAQPLDIVASSSNAALIPDANIEVVPDPSLPKIYYVTAYPNPGKSGDATITLMATDSYGQRASANFTVTVLTPVKPAPPPPTPPSNGGGGAFGIPVIGLLGFAALGFALKRRWPH